MTNKVAVISLTDPSADHARILHVFEYVLDRTNNEFLFNRKFRYKQMLYKKMN